MQKILITNNHLHDIKGSELVTLELAEIFLSIGWQVTIYTNLYLSPLANEVSRLPNQENLSIYQNNDESVPTDFDIIWIQQNTIPSSVIKALSTTGLKSYIIWHHMSPIIHIELPILVQIENQLSDIITAISQGTTDRIQEFGIKKSKIKLFENPAPDYFSDYPTRKILDNKPKSLLIVSNHAPTEVIEAIPLLIKNSITVDHLGEGGHIRRVTPDILSHYDAILTIGKTVQYAVSMGIPVYEYDHFGGYGWLNSENFYKAAEKNFSGRACGEKKEAGDIAHEIINHYIPARDFITDNKEYFSTKYRLSNRVSQLLQQLSPTPSLKKLTSQQALQVDTFNELNRGLYRTLMYYKNINSKV